jgi:hypothetical protein
MLIDCTCLRPEGPHRRTQSAGDPAVTVITIGAETSGAPSGILPSVLRGKPRVVTGQGGTTARPASSRPDVSTVVLPSPPPRTVGQAQGCHGTGRHHRPARLLTTRCKYCGPPAPPPVLWGKPRVVTGQGGTTARPASSRPDVSTVVLPLCTVG